MKRRFAIIGSGIAGVATTYVAMSAVLDGRADFVTLVIIAAASIYVIVGAVIAPDEPE